MASMSRPCHLDRPAGVTKRGRSDELETLLAPPLRAVLATQSTMTPSDDWRSLSAPTADDIPQRPRTQRGSRQNRLASS